MRGCLTLGLFAACEITQERHICKLISDNVLGKGEEIEIRGRTGHHSSNHFCNIASLYGT